MRVSLRIDSKRTPPWRQQLATAILILAAFGAIYAFISAVSSVWSAGPETLVVESWRLFGFLVFAGLFLLLAYRPNQYPGVWELVIFHKAAIAIFLVVAGSDATDGTATAVTDGVLAIALIIAYLLVEGYRNWDAFRNPGSERSV